MMDPSNNTDENGNPSTIGGFTELAEWATGKALATKPAVELAEDVYGFVLPDGYKVAQIDVSGIIDARAEHPRLRQGHVIVNTVESFIDYVNRHKADSTTLWVKDSGEVVAVIDDHEGNPTDEQFEEDTPLNAVPSPGWGKHRATLRLINTPSWARWVDANGKLLEQQEFAELIEASIPDIVRPDSADLLEVAQNIQVTRTAGFSSDMRLRSGTVKFHYVEDDTASAGDLEIPQTIELALAPYLGVDKVAVEARFIYRMLTGKLKLGFVIDRLAELLLEVQGTLIANINDGTQIKPFAGSPRS